MIGHVSPVSVIDMTGPFLQDRVYTTSNFEHSFELLFIKIKGSINAKIEIRQGSVLSAEVSGKTETIYPENATFGSKCSMSIKVLGGQVHQISLFIRTINANARAIDIAQI